MNAVPRLPKQDLHRNRVLQHRDPLLPRQRRQSQLDVRPRRVPARVQHPRLRMRPLARQRDLSVLRVKRHAQPHQVLDPGRRLARQHARCLLVHQPRPRVDRVPQMLLGGIACPYRRRYPPLRPARVAVVNTPLREHKDAPVFARQQRGVQPGNPGANDDVVVRVSHLRTAIEEPQPVGWGHLCSSLSICY